MARRRKSRGGRSVDRASVISRVVLACLLLATSSRSIHAQGPSLQIPPEAQASPAFDAVRATNAYLASVPADKKARSDAYFESGYWLQLWNFVYGVAVLWALLAFGWSARMRDAAERRTTRRPLQTAI
jgi:hypothetical protein